MVSGVYPTGVLRCTPTVYSPGRVTVRHTPSIPHSRTSPGVVGSKDSVEGVWGRPQSRFNLDTNVTECPEKGWTDGLSVGSSIWVSSEGGDNDSVRHPFNWEVRTKGGTGVGFPLTQIEDRDGEGGNVVRRRRYTGVRRFRAE